MHHLLQKKNHHVFYKLSLLCEQSSKTWLKYEWTSKNFPSFFRFSLQFQDNVYFTVLNIWHHINANIHFSYFCVYFTYHYCKYYCKSLLFNQREKQSFLFLCVCVFVCSFVPGSCRVAVVTAALYKISFTVKALYCTYADRPDVVEKNNKVISWTQMSLWATVDFILSLSDESHGLKEEHGCN